MTMPNTEAALISSQCPTELALLLGKKGRRRDMLAVASDRRKQLAEKDRSRLRV